LNKGKSAPGIAQIAMASSLESEYKRCKQTLILLVEKYVTAHKHEHYNHTSYDVNVVDHTNLMISGP